MSGTVLLVVDVQKLITNDRLCFLRGSRITCAVL